MDIAISAKGLKLDCASLQKDVEERKNELKMANASLKNNVASLESNVISLRNDVEKSNEALKAELKSDIARNAKELKSDVKNAIKNSRDEIMGHVEKLELRIGEDEKSIVAVPEMVKTVASKMNESADKLKQVNSKVALNSASITETLEKRKDEQPASHPGSLSSPSDGGSSIAEALAGQTHFNTALSLGYSPTMFFGGELHKYV